MSDERIKKLEEKVASLTQLVRNLFFYVEAQANAHTVYIDLLMKGPSEEVRKKAREEAMLRWSSSDHKKGMEETFRILLDAAQNDGESSR